MMKCVALSTALLLALSAPAFAQPAKAEAAFAPKGTPVMIEYYYRVRWGGMDEFRTLYAKNHQPILDEMKRLGFITKIESASPYNHMVGDPRWDWRVTITYRSAEDAVGEGTGYEAKGDEVAAKLFPDLARFKAEEARRFSLLEEHWDVIVSER